jgi:predicted nuclease of predicted toxin-antitoxin system
VRLLLDAHLSGSRIADPLRRKGHDVRALSEESDAEGLEDEQVLALAAAERRILVTSDVSDFPRLLRDWAGASRSHNGVILVHGIGTDEFSAIAHGILRLLQEKPRQPEWIDVVLAISRTASR